MFCECELVQLFSLVFCMGRAVHKFDFRIVTKETPNKWRSLCKNLRHAVTEVHVCDWICMFASDRRDDR